MALELGNGDHQSRMTLGRRVLRPVVSDVRVGVDRGDGELGTFDPEVSGTFPATGEVLFNVVYGPTDNLTGILLTPPENPVVGSVADDAFAAQTDQLFAQFGQSGAYVSKSLGVTVHPWKNGYPAAMFDEVMDDIAHNETSEGRMRRGSLELRLVGEDSISEIAYEIDPRPGVDTWQLVDADNVVTGPEWRVMGISEVIGGVATLRLETGKAQAARGVDRRDW